MTETSTTPAIQVWNRASGQMDQEAVFGEDYLRWLYESGSGRALSRVVCTNPWLSRLYGAYQGSRLSASKIDAFVARFKIPMHEYEPGPFASFNDFFIRALRPGARMITKDPTKLAAFAEGRYFAFPSVGESDTFPVKGLKLSAATLLGREDLGREFAGGPILIARLCPTDYHRFHFPDDGHIALQYRLRGEYHSVNPVALAFRGDILVSNERHVSILETRNFGRLAYVEVGALCVGKIVQTHPYFSGGAPEFKRGDEKGYFLFGGSTVVLVGRPGTWLPADDLVEKTAGGVETLVRLGEPVGVR